MRERATAEVGTKAGALKRALPGRTFAGIWLVAVALVATLPARAQISNAPLSLDTQNIERIPETDRQSREWWVNYEECVANDVFRFPIRVNDTGNPVEVWAGTSDCAANREVTGGNRGQCWIVARESTPRFSFDIDIPVRNIVARNVDVDNPPVNLSDDVCERSVTPSGEQFTFYVMQVVGGKAESSVTWEAPPEGVGFDLIGPAPPASIDVKIGESQLVVSIGDVDPEDDRVSFEAFCVPQGTMALPEAEAEADPVDAGAADASSDATTTAPATPTTSDAGAPPGACATPIIRAGERPPLGFSCGVAAETSSTLRTNRLTNNITYAVGVSGQDAVGNAGVLSPLQCGTPTELDDFYELYSRNGGVGGGGFCSLPRGPRTTSHVALIALGALAALLRWRRRGNPS